MRYYSIFATALCFIACCSSPQDKSAKSTSAPAEVSEVETGKILFNEKCAVCHGADGTAGISNAANLQASRLDARSVVQTITNGGKAMPAFKGQLDSNGIAAIAEYVIKLRKEK